MSELLYGEPKVCWHVPSCRINIFCPFLNWSLLRYKEMITQVYYKKKWADQKSFCQEDCAGSRIGRKSYTLWLFERLLINILRF